MTEKLDRFVKAVAFDFGHALVREETVSQNIKLMPGVADVLPHIGLPMAVWANTRSAGQETVREMLQAAGIGRYFSAVATSVDAGFRKPAPDFFKFALSLWDFHEQEILYVGNQLNTDVVGAEACGIRTAWLSGQEFRSADETMTLDQVKPSFTISDFRELPALLDKIAVQTGCLHPR